MKQIKTLTLLLLVFAFSSCEKDVEVPIREFVIETTITEITTNSAKCNCNIPDIIGALPVTTRGVCWSTNQNPTIENSHTTDSSGTGAFSSSITGLTINTTYYLRAYATNSKGTFYGEEKSFQTQNGIAVVTTNTVGNITTTTASCGGNVNSDGGFPVTARGVCWSTSQNPTINDSKTTNGSGTGAFTSSITGLTINTTYYLRAYATNSSGTYYGEEKSFQTQNGMASVTTNTVSSIMATTATCGGNVSSDGGLPVTARGVCWSTSSNPTISGNHTSNGSGTGSFTSNLTGLTMGRTYYVRAYATNSQGTFYGVQKSFTTNNYLVLANGTDTYPNYPINALGLDMTNQHYQMIYPASSLTAANGKSITKLTYYAVNSYSDFGSPYLYVRVGLTTTTNLASGFAATPSNSTYALITVSGGCLTIYLDTPLNYTSGYNLLIDFQRSTAYSNSSSTYFYFYGLNGSSIVSRSYRTGYIGMPIESTDSFLPKLRIDF